MLFLSYLGCFRNSQGSQTLRCTCSAQKAFCMPIGTHEARCFECLTFYGSPGGPRLPKVAHHKLTGHELYHTRA